MFIELGEDYEFYKVLFEIILIWGLYKRLN